jgi:hypothetical protein
MERRVRVAASISESFGAFVCVCLSYCWPATAVSSTPTSMATPSQSCTCKSQCLSGSDHGRQRKPRGEVFSTGSCTETKPFVSHKRHMPAPFTAAEFESLTCSVLTPRPIPADPKITNESAIALTSRRSKSRNPGGVTLRALESSHDDSSSGFCSSRHKGSSSAKMILSY